MERLVLSLIGEASTDGDHHERSNPRDRRGGGARACVLTAGAAQAAPKPAPAPYTLGRIVVEQDVSLVNMQNDSGDFLYNPVTGTQSRPVTVDCPTGKVPLSGGGTMTTSAYAPLYTDKPVMVLADSRPTATGWSLVWLATGGGMPGSVGTMFTAHVSVVRANP